MTKRQPDDINLDVQSDILSNGTGKQSTKAKANSLKEAVQELQQLKQTMREFQQLLTAVEGINREVRIHTTELKSISMTNDLILSRLQKLNNQLIK